MYLVVPRLIRVAAAAALVGSIKMGATGPVEKGTWAEEGLPDDLGETEAGGEAEAEGDDGSREEREARRALSAKLMTLVTSGLCRPDDIKHEAVMRSLLPPASPDPPAAQAMAALERLDQFVKMTLAQRVAGDEALKAKAGHNALVAFLLSDHKAISQLAASASTAKVPFPRAP